ncbi:MAG: hypothetical protein M3O50_16440 [Myxococcota bacterium]|nr:hypothetical protein [Myxococcota bacterium]
MVIIIVGRLSLQRANFASRIETTRTTEHDSFYTSATPVPTGFDDVSCSAFAAAPKQTGFVHISNKPLGAAYKP